MPLKLWDGAGRVMSRGQAKKLISLEDHKAAMAGIEARTDEGVLDESPAAYKDIGAVMAAQEDLGASATDCGRQ